MDSLGRFADGVAELGPLLRNGSNLFQAQVNTSTDQMASGVDGGDVVGDVATDY